MAAERFADFDVDALYEALDAQRCARAMSWEQAARAISAQFRDAPSRPLAPSTLTGMRGRSVLEGDGVLQMLRWLGRAPESFVPGCAGRRRCRTFRRTGSFASTRSGSTRRWTRGERNVG
jgi:hypothetical protein